MAEPQGRTRVGWKETGGQAAVEFSDIQPGQRLSGVVADGDVTVVSVESHGETSATLVYRDDAGRLGEQIITAADLEGMSPASERRWSFDADGADFRLASEARRMQNAHLAAPYAAVDTSNIEPYPHQIDAVYNRLLARKVRYEVRYLGGGQPTARAR